MLLGMALRPLYLMSFPVVFYAGFSYGSALGTECPTTPVYTLDHSHADDGSRSVVQRAERYCFSYTFRPALQLQAQYGRLDVHQRVGWGWVGVYLHRNFRNVACDEDGPTK